MKIKEYKVQTIICCSLLSLIVLVLVFFIVYNANWLFGDQAEFLRTTAISKIDSFYYYIIPAAGRFFPLGHYDYNILTLIPLGYTATAHYILNAVSFIIFIIAIFLLLYKIVSSVHYPNLKGWIILFTMIFLSQRVYAIFLDLIFPERIVVTLLSVFMLSTWYFYKTDKWVYGIVAWLIATYMIYCKEPIFGALMVFALTNLIFNYKYLSRNNRIFQWMLILNSLIFIILYYFLVYRNIVTAYTGNHGENNLMTIALRMIWSQKIVVIAIILFFPRIYKILLKYDHDHLFYDGLLFAGLAYFVACLILKLNFTYYYLPAIILVTPAIIYWLMHYLNPLAVFGIMAFFALFYLVKFPTMIRESQQIRINTYLNVAKIANYVSAGYQLIWYETKSPENKSWNNELCDWERSSLQTYIAYILKDEQFDFVNVSSLSEIKNSRCLILYPMENDLINNKSVNQFLNENQHFSKDTIAQIAGITIMKLYK